MSETWVCAHCGKENEDGRLWCVLCCEPREDAAAPSASSDPLTGQQGILPTDEA